MITIVQLLKIKILYRKSYGKLKYSGLPNQQWFAEYGCFNNDFFGDIFYKSCQGNLKFICILLATTDMNCSWHQCQ